MDKRKVFEMLLYETEYANVADSKYVEERLSLLRKWIKDNMPTKLYRYRRCNENSISAFSKDEIWGSSYLTFNDSLECIPCYDLNKVNDIFNKEFDTEIIERNISQLKQCETRHFSKRIGKTVAKTKKHVGNIYLKQSF